MFEILETLAPENEERLPDDRVDKIKASVLSRIEEDKPMKKHFRIKPLLIAAAITATGAISALSAGAVTTPAISEEKLSPTTAASQPESSATPAASENAPKPDTTNVVPGVDAESVDKVESPYELTDLLTEKLRNYIRAEKPSDMEFLYEDNDGISYYRSSTGETISVRFISDDEENVAFYYYDF